MVQNVQTGLYRTMTGGVVSIHKVGRDPATGRRLAFGLLSPKKGKPRDDSWDANTGAHLSEAMHNLIERVPTIGDSQRG